MLRTILDVKNVTASFYNESRAFSEYRPYVATTLTCCSVLDKTLTAVCFSQVTLVDSGISVFHQLDGEDETAVIVILPVARRPWKPGKQWAEIFQLQCESENTSDLRRPA